MLSPKTQDSRPITDRVKESLFSVLYKYDPAPVAVQGDLPPFLSSDRRHGGKLVADLFCGVGSLGLEALSRGAEFVTFVEKDPKIIKILEKNIEKAGFIKKSKVVRADAFKTGALSDEQKYDLVFVDPPYSTTREIKEGSPLSELLVILQEQLAPNGIVVVRTNRRTELLSAGHLTVEQYGRLQIIEQRRWGTMAVTILQQKSR